MKKPGIVDKKLFLLVELVGKYWYRQKDVLFLFLFINSIGFIFYLLAFEPIIPVFFVYSSMINFVFAYTSDRKLVANNFYAVYRFPVFLIHCVKITYIYILASLQLLLVFTYLGEDNTFADAFGKSHAFLSLLYFLVAFLYRINLVWQRWLISIVGSIIILVLISILHWPLILLILGVSLALLFGLIRNEESRFF